MHRLSAFLFIAACSAQTAEHSVALTISPDSGVAVDATVSDSVIDSPPPDAVDCDRLCLSGDSVPSTLVDSPEPWLTVVGTTLDQSLPVRSAGGTADVTVTVVGNFGRPGEDDGLSVAIGDAAPCPRSRRSAVPGEPAVASCSVAVALSPGVTSVPIRLYQWDGSREAWAVSLETASVTLR